MENQPKTILKKVPSVKTPGGRRPSLGSPTRASQGNGVHFAAPPNLSEILKRAADKDMKDAKANQELEGMVTHFRNQRGSALVDLLQQVQQNVTILKPRMEYFVLALLRIGWADQDKPVVSAYRDFLVNLVTAQIYFTKPVVKMLVTNLSGVANRTALAAAAAAASSDGGATEVPDFDAIEATVFENTHDTLQVILKVTPLAGREAMIKYTKECMPYGLTQDTQSHTNYLSNLMRATFYPCLSPGDRLHLLALIVDRLVQIDAHVDKERLEEEAAEGDHDDCNKRKSQHQVAKANLDSGMQVLVDHVDRLQDDEALKSFYFELVRVFESHVLPVHTGHVQFAVFYVMAKFKGPALTTHFLEFLWKKFQSPNTPSVIRQATMSYIASLTSRAQFVSVPVLFSCLEKVSGWIHAYAAAAGAGAVPSLVAHGPFYAACQALFYMFVFRHEELTVSKKHLAFLRTLHFNTIVTCRLNPLFYCLYQVVANFSAIARNYQLAYCETVIQRNNRISLPSVDTPQAALSASKAEVIATTNNHLDSFFPFDPYRLPGSKGHFQQYYREYRGANFDESDDDDETSDESSSSGEEESDEESEAEVSKNVSELPSSQPMKQTDKKSEIDDYLMEFDSSGGGGGMETPKPPRAKRRRTDSMLSTGSIGPIDFGYGTSPGFKQ